MALTICCNWILRKETCLKSRISLPAIPQPDHPRVWYTALLLINRFLHKRVQICFRRQLDDPTIRSKSKCCWVRVWRSPRPHCTAKPCDYRLTTVVLPKPQSGSMAFWCRQVWPQRSPPRRRPENTDLSLETNSTTNSVLKKKSWLGTGHWADISVIFSFLGNPPWDGENQAKGELQLWDLADASL